MLLLANAMLTALAGAVPIVTVQVEAPGPVTFAGAQVRLLSSDGAVKVIVACWLTPLMVAVTVAFWLLLMVAEVAANVALVCPDVMATLVGTESKLLLLTRETITVLVAALLRAAVQVLEALLARDDGEQDSELSWAGALPVAVRAKVRETPFKVAVSIAV